MNFEAVALAPAFGIVSPFQFGLPQFSLGPIVTMCIVMVVVMIELTGMFLALGEMTGKQIGPDDIARGLRADGVGTIIGGVLQRLPLYLVFAERRPCRA